MGQARQTFESLVEGLRGRAAQPYATAFDERPAGFVDLFRAGEGGVAVENLCSNLYEFEVPVTEHEHAALVEFAAQSGVLAETRSQLDALKLKGG